MLDNFKKSFYFDFRLITLHGVRVSHKLFFIITKYYSLICRLINRNGMLVVGAASIKVDNISQIGTIQSNIIDFYDTIYLLGILTPNATIIDAGANIGQFTCAAKLFYPNTKVIAFEPDPKVFNSFLKNTNKLKNVTCHNYALGNQNKTVNFYRSNITSMSTLMPSSKIKNIIKVGLRKLDHYNLKEVDLLKIDVEGFELEVINGARKTIIESKYILVEISLMRTGSKDNIELLSNIKRINGRASILKFGRPLGVRAFPTCQDVLIGLSVDN